MLRPLKFAYERQQRIERTIESGKQAVSNSYPINVFKQAVRSVCKFGSDFDPREIFRETEYRFSNAAQCLAYRRSNLFPVNAVKHAINSVSKCFTSLYPVKLLNKPGHHAKQSVNVLRQ